MLASLNQIQQERVYKSFQRTSDRIAQTRMDVTARRKQMNDSRAILQQRVNEKDLPSLHLEEAMIEYLLIREYEEALHLPQTPVPVILLPHFQNISHPNLQAAVNRLAVFSVPALPVNWLDTALASIQTTLTNFSASALPVNPLPTEVPALFASTSTATSKKAISYEALIDMYEAVRTGRITSTEIIQELARHFFEIASDPVTSQGFPFDAGRAAYSLLQQVKWLEERDKAGDIYDANAQADIPGPRGPMII